VRATGLAISGGAIAAAGENGFSEIAISARLVSSTPLLLATMAHEMIHLYQDESGAAAAITICSSAFWPNVTVSSMALKKRIFDILGKDRLAFNGKIEPRL
jgi:hypothetical protein